MRRLCLLLLLLMALAGAAHASAPPTLHIQSINDRGTPDLVPGQRVNVIIELRSEERQGAQLQHVTPDGVTLERANASTGVLGTDDPLNGGSFGVHWSGEISATLPLVLILAYRVRADAAPGDRQVAALGRVGSGQLRASNVLRVCCVSAPPPQSSGARPIRLPIVRA